MDTLFLKLLNMSLTASVMAMAVLLLRVLLKKAPRWVSCLLWGLVALRLVCPFAPESNLSLIRNNEPITHKNLSVEGLTESEPVEMGSLSIEDSVPMSNVLTTQTEDGFREEELIKLSIPSICGYAWLVGVGAMLVYAFSSYVLLKHRVSSATRLEKNIRQSEFIDTPFVLGVFRPTIYLPYGLKHPHIDHILAHERSHISRGDHLIKPLGFLILSVHWFNPIVWLSYILLCRDIEAACDERVIKKMTHEQRQSYSATLLRCSIHRRRITACPVAFGETGVKGRIKNVMNYKKPTIWIIVASMLLCAILAGCFLTDPKEEPSQEQLSVSREDQEKIDALVERIAAKVWDREYSALHPDHYRVIDSQARDELLAYGDKALEYLLSELRTSESDFYSVKEQITVFLCEDMTKVVSIEKRYESGWWEIPGQWLTMYDMRNGNKETKSRLQPGFYRIIDVLYGGEQQRFTMQDRFETEYMVTDDSFFIRNVEERYDIINSFVDGHVETGDFDKTGLMRQIYAQDYTDVIQVDWQWEDSAQAVLLWGRLLQKHRDECKESNSLKDFLEEEKFQYQQIDENRCLVQTGTGLYTDLYLIGHSEDQLQYIYQLQKYQ